MAGNAAGDAFQDLFAATWKKFYSGNIPTDSDTLILTFNRKNIIRFVYDKGTMGHGVPHGKYLRIKYYTVGKSGDYINVDIDLASYDDADEIETAKGEIKQLEGIMKPPQNKKFSNGSKFGYRNMNMTAGFSGYEFK